MVVARNSAAHLFASSHLLREVDGKYIIFDPMII